MPLLQLVCNEKARRFTGSQNTCHLETFDSFARDELVEAIERINATLLPWKQLCAIGPSLRFYFSGIAGCDCNYWNPDRHVAAGGSDS